MVLLQVLLAFLRRSLGKIFQAIFGWAVLAVFGHVGKREKALLSVVIGAAASWPILVLGVAFPRAVAFLVTLLPIPEGVSQGGRTRRLDRGGTGDPVDRGRDLRSESRRSLATFILVPEPVARVSRDARTGRGLSDRLRERAGGEALGAPVP